MTFSQKFTIHPVGQGLFYSGTFKVNSEVKFRMVFDCGNRFDKKAADDEVDLYRDSLFIKNGVLDLLIISHFDEDHVSHIGKLLAGGIKVRKLIMPFITFQERLFLVLRIISRSKGYNLMDEFIINFILDPLGTLKDNLDGDSEIYLIDGDDSDDPIPLSENNNEVNTGFEEEGRFVVYFEDKNPLDAKVIKKEYYTSTEVKVFEVNHKNKGTLKTSKGLELMKFLFYKRSIGQGEKDFFDKIEELFRIKYEIQTDELDEIVDRVKNIESFSGSPLKEIFIKAKKEKIDPIKPKKLKQFLKIIDPNTTSICLLHKNLISNLHQNKHGRIMQIQKFITPQNSVIIPWCRFLQNTYGLNNNFPNVLLTSDTFLLKDVQVDPFLKHFQNYWNDFWLFQIPHHGSKKSSNFLLHSNIPSRAYNFINYGIPNKDKHPDQSVIYDLVATGHSVRLIPVTQYQGLFFELIYP